jgi:hypothetical protein
MATRKALCLVSGLFEEVNTPTDKLDFAGNSTTDLAEGTNLYFLNSRARQAISVTDSGGDGSLSYDNTTGVITYTGPSASEVRAHLSAANSGTGFGSLAYDNSTGVFTYSVVTASNIRQQISVTDSGGDGSLSYDNSTGVITYTGPSATEVRSKFSVAVGSGLTYNSTTGEFGTSNIPNSQLQNSSITFGSTSTSLGGTVTALSITSYTASSFVNVGAGVGSANSINIEPGAIVFEGSTVDGFETTLQVVDPTADQTITFPNASGTVALLTSLSVAAGSGLTYNSSTGEFGTSAIPNAQLANSSITIGSTSVALGSTAATINGLTSLQSTSLLVGDGTAATPGLRFNSDVNTGIYRVGTDTIGLATNGTHGVALDATQRLISGHTSAINLGTVGSPYTPRLQVIGTAIADSDLALLNYGAGNTQLHLGRSGSSTIGTNTAVSSGFSLGSVSFDGTDGTDWQTSAAIFGTAEGTIGTGIVPGRLEFLTANATGVITERLRIDSSNNFTFFGNPELRINNAANTFRTTLTTAGATANRTITLPDLTGTVLLNTSTLPSTFSDSTFRVQDNADATKQLAFECSGIDTATTRTMTIPNENGTISTQDFATAIAIALG